MSSQEPGTKNKGEMSQHSEVAIFRKAKKESTGMGTYLGVDVDVEACSSLGQTAPAGRHPRLPWQQSGVLLGRSTHRQ